MRKALGALLALAFLVGCGPNYTFVLEQRARIDPPSDINVNRIVWSTDIRPTAELLNGLMKPKEREAACGGLRVPYMIERYGDEGLRKWALVWCSDPLAYELQRMPILHR